MLNKDYYPVVIQAVPGADKTVFAYFSDGRIKKYDMKPLIEKGGVFDRLKEEAFFRGAITVLNGTVAWDLSGHYDPSNCIDVDPFEVYSAQTVEDPLEQMQTKGGMG